MKKACVLIADGSEEIEALTPVDYLRRAGIEVTLVGLRGFQVKGARGIVITANAVLESVCDILFDALIIPGGMPGASNIAASAKAVEMIKRHYREGKIVAAICAGPAVVLQGACGLLDGKRFTAFPGTESQVPRGIFVPDRVVRDGTIITSRGPGTAGEFAVSIIECLSGRQAAQSVAEAVLLH
ncbi:MAG: DJ-1/PfpI family protein [Spirochaetaceae bacterium]|nr:DJ-1/PfpI family protein [Spirochaetaceae bacterium]